MTLYFCSQKPPQLVVAEGNNIFEDTETHIHGQRPTYFARGRGHKVLVVIENPFAAIRICCSLWPKAATLTDR